MKIVKVVGLEVTTESEIVLKSALLMYVLHCEAEMKRDTSASGVAKSSKARSMAVEFLSQIQKTTIKGYTFDVQSAVRESLPDLFRFCPCGLPYHGNGCANEPGAHRVHCLVFDDGRKVVLNSRCATEKDARELLSDRIANKEAFKDERYEYAPKVVYDRAHLGVVT
jgi:hypothetical protein